MFWNKYKNVGKTFIFKIFILPIKELDHNLLAQVLLILVQILHLCETINKIEDCSTLSRISFRYRMELLE